MPKVLVVQTTTAQKEDAQAIARSLVEQRLAACVKVIGPVESVYRWQGAVESAKEWICQVKTTEATLDQLLKAIRQLHPYDEPEIVALPVVGGSPSYLKWVDEQVS